MSATTITTQRKNILQQCSDAIRAMVDGQRSAQTVLLLCGEAGIGKSTLIAQLREEVRSNAAFTGVCMASVECSAPLGGHHVGSAESLQPWAALLAQIATATDSTSSSFRTVAGQLARAWVKFIPIVGDLIESTLDTIEIFKEKNDDQEGRETAISQDQVFQQYINLLKHISAIHPLVLVIDDMHWADESSLNLLFAAARQLQEAKVLFLGAYRQDDIRNSREGNEHPLMHVLHELQRYDLAQNLNMPLWEKEDILSLLRQRYKNATLRPTEPDLEWLVRTCGGNALFLTSILRMLESDGSINAVDGSMRGELRLSQLPTSVSAVLRERMRRLDEKSLELLRTASVEGEEFSLDILSHLSGEPPLALLKQLRSIEEKHGLIHSRGKVQNYGRETTMYEFTHLLFHDMLYQGLEEEEREMTHALIADTLANNYQHLSAATERERLSARIAIHASIGKQHERAARMYYASARAAQRIFSVSESLAQAEKAKEQYQKAFAQDKAQDKELRILYAHILLLQGELHILRSELSQSLEYLNTAYQIYKQEEERESAINCRLRMIACYSRQSMTSQMVEMAKEVFDEAQQIDYPLGQGQAVVHLGIAHEAHGEFSQALACYTQAVEVFRRVNANDNAASAMLNMGRVHLYQMEYDIAEGYINAAAALAEKSRNNAILARCLNTKGSILRIREDYGAALEAFRRALALYEQVGDRNSMASMISNIGITCFDTADYENAVEYLGRSIAIKEDFDDKNGLAVALHAMGCTLDRLGRFNEAYPFHTRALELYTFIDERYSVAHCLWGLGWHYGLQKKASDAMRYLHEAEAIARTLDAKDLLQTIDDAYTELGLARGEV